MALKYFVMIGLYVKTICLIYGVVTFVPPTGTWPGEIFPPHAAVGACTLIMASMSFGLRCGSLSRTGMQFTGSMHLNFEN